MAISFDEYDKYSIAGKITNINNCTAYGFLDHSLKEDCATIQSH